jgi:hypothetical protein
LRGDRCHSIDSYNTGSPGGKPPRKPLGTKTWRKPGQIYVIEELEKKRKEYQNAMVKKIKIQSLSIPEMSVV